MNDADEPAGRRSHELRTPLNAIIGFSELLKDGLAGPLTPQQQGMAARIHESGLKLLALIDAPDGSAPDVTVRAPSDSTVAAAGQPRRALVIEDDPHAAELLRVNLEQAGFEVQCIDDASDLARATRRTPDLITLDLLLRERSGWDVLEAIRNDARLANVPVVICSVLAEQHKGIALGASTVLQKPVSRERLHAALDALNLQATAATPTTVLVVDDDPMAVELVAIHLEDRDCKVLRAHDGGVAIELARAARPDLIILDLMMPDVSGFDVVQAVRSEPALRTVPILVMTGKSLTPDDRQRLDGHVLQIIDKAGFDRDRFLSEVGRALHTAQED